MPRLADTWYCTECAKNGKPYVYVTIGKKKCPSGHERKGYADRHDKNHKKRV